MSVCPTIYICDCVHERFSPTFLYPRHY